jgi:YVTN family beta-propeller protein
MDNNPKNVCTTLSIYLLNLFFLCFFFLLFPFISCSSIEERDSSFDPYKGQITLFLNGPEDSSLDITFVLSAVTIIAEDGTMREIMTSPMRINSIAAQSRQILLGEQALSEGKYRMLRFTVKDAFLMKKGEKASLSLPADVADVDIDIAVASRQSTSLFVYWNADASVSDGFGFSPAFTVKGESPELSTLLIYVTNEDSNNVSVINRQLGQTVATIMVGEKPRGITAGLRTGLQRVYVANSESNSISVIDPDINKIENEIPIRLGWGPEDIAIHGSSSEKELLFVANYRSDNVSVVDTTTQQEIEKIEVGIGPIAIEADPPVERLIGTRFLSFEDMNTLRTYRERFFNVYVANKNSNTVSVLRMNTRDNRFEGATTFDVQWSPIAIEVDYQKGKVFVANYTSDKLSVLDIPEIIKGNISGAVSLISNVGTSITDVLSDPEFDRLYLLKETSGEILFLRVFTEGLRNVEAILPPIVGTVRVGNNPRSFILDPETRMLYIVNRGDNTISVVNKTTKRQEQVIPVGRRPYDITVVQN